MPPTITKEGQRAKNRIAEVRQNVNNGLNAEQARKTVRFIENPNDATKQSAIDAGVGQDVLRTPSVPNIQPTVSANDLTTPPPKLNMPTPAVGTIPERTGRIVSNVTRDVNGFISAQTTEAQRLKEKQEDYAAFADQGTLQDLFKTTMEGAGVTPEALKELKDIDLQLADANTASDLTKTRVAGAAGQTLGQAQREITQEDRENAVRNSGLAARAEVLRGNIETATALAKDTVAIAFQDRTLQAQNMLQQIEFLQGQVDDQTSQLLEQEKRDYEAELARVEELKTNISTAMVNGASQSEIMQMNDPTVDDATKLALAQSITARGANQMRDLEISQKSASIRASNASAAMNEAQLVAYNKAQEDAANGILSPEQMKTANDVNKDFEAQPIVKSYNEGLQSYMVLEDTLANGIDGIEDIELVYNFMKAIDPTSVVRPEEFDTVASSGNIFRGTAAKYNRYFGSGGILPEEVKQDLMRTARAGFEAKNAQYYNVKSEYAKRMENTVGTTNGADYLTAYEAAAPLTEADNNIVFGISNATPEDIQEIMLMTEQMSNGTQGANIYK